MTPKQRRFKDEYLKDLNGTRAAMRAGYSPKTARTQASDLLTKPDIQAAVQVGMDKRAEKAAITADFVLEGIRQTIAGCEAEGVRFATPALKGYELLGKHLKLFTDKVEVSGSLAAMTDEEVQVRLEQVLARHSSQA